MKIKVIIPNSGMKQDTLRDRERMLRLAVSEETEISVECISGGPAEIANHTDELLAGIWLLAAGKKAEEDGFDAVVIYCFSDPGLDALREQLSIPVIGPGEIAMAMAGMFGERCAVITTTTSNISRITGRIRKEPAMMNREVVVSALDIPVLELRENPEYTRERLLSVCRQAVEKEHIDTVILGCLGMADYGKYIKNILGVEVLDPALVGTAFAEMCARLNILGSKRKYQRKNGEA